MKLIDLHKEWMEKGLLPNSGLCNTLAFEEPPYSTLLNEILPNKNGYLLPNGEFIMGDKVTSKIRDEYTPLRQTIVLLICAMNNEI